VAEHTLLLMLAVSRRLIELDRGLRQGRWMMWDRRLESFNLSGRMLGLIGMGRIGQAVAKRASAFDMRLQYHDPVRVAGFAYTPLDDLLATSDFVSLHVPLTPGIHGTPQPSLISRSQSHGCIRLTN
jgi:phosphoglycerate dehydrogenase-like enzyme